MKKSIKRTLSLLLALTMVLSLGLPAYAVGAPAEDEVVISEEPIALPEQEPVEEPVEKPVTLPIGAGKKIDFTEEEEIISDDLIVDFSDVEDELVVETEAAPAKNFVYSESATGFTVEVSAPAGALPLGTEMFVDRLVDLSAVQAAVDNAEDLNGSVQLAADISFWLEGKEIEPAEGAKLVVRMSAPEIETIAAPIIVHIPDGENAVPEIVEQLSSGDIAMADTVSFETGSFSVYAILDDGSTVIPGKEHRATYEFYNSDGSKYYFTDAAGNQQYTQILKNGEILEEVGIPTIGASQNAKFVGWYVVDDPESTTYGAKEELGVAKTVGSEDVTIKLKAKMQGIVNVMFVTAVMLDDQGQPMSRSVVTVQQVEFTAGQTEPITINVSGITTEAPTTDQAVIGWNRDEDAANGVEDDPATPADEYVPGVAEGTNGVITLYPDGNGEITDVMMFPAIARAAWLYFNENDGGTGGGASYTPPVFVTIGGKPTKPADPHRTGYTFGGWYTTPECTTAFDFNAPMTQSTTVYAKWEGGATTYSIIVWVQRTADSARLTSSSNLPNDGNNKKTYDFYKAYSVDSNTDATATVPQNPYKNLGSTLDQYGHIKYNRCDADKTVAADGSTVMNVYYDRDVYILRFRDSQYGADQTVWYGLYDATFAESGKTWTVPSGQMWKSSERNYTFLDSFKDFDNSTKTDMTLWHVSAPNDYYSWIFQKETLTSGQYATANTFQRAGGLYLSEKYQGFTLSQYRDGGNNAQWRTAHVDDYIADAYRDLYIRYTRNSYNIEFHNGTRGTDGTIVRTDSVKYEAPLGGHGTPTVTYPVAADAGHYKFLGWFADSSWTTMVSFTPIPDSIKEEYSAYYGVSTFIEYGENDKMPAHNFPLYAGYALKGWDCAINPNGGTLTNTNQAGVFWLDYGQTFSSDLKQNIVREGYSFQGWMVATVPFKADGENLDLLDIYTDANNHRFVGDYSNWKMTDSPWEFGTPISGATALMAKWFYLSTMSVVYDAGEGSNAPKDNGAYSDHAQTVAFTAPTPPENKFFLGWDIQGTATIEKLHPGDVFEVSSDYANEGVVTLVAVYGSSMNEDDPVPVTHIDWYANNTTTAQYPVRDPDTFLPVVPQELEELPTHVIDEGIQINEDVAIRGADTFTNFGYVFLGWAKLHKDGDQMKDHKNVVVSAPTDGAIMDYALTEDNLYLKYNAEDGKFYVFSEKDNDWMPTSKVAADENLPYDDMYAVWEMAYFYVYHTGVATNNVEKHKVDEAKVNGEIVGFNLTTNIPAGKLYGGYYSEYAGVPADFDAASLTYDENGKATFSGTVYDGKNVPFDGSKAYTRDENGRTGLNMIPEAGKVYYVKEVPADKFLQHRMKFTYNTAGGKMGAAWLITNADDANYQGIGFTVVNNYFGSIVDEITITPLNTGKPQTFTVAQLFKNNGTKMAYKLVYWDPSVLTPTALTTAPEISKQDLISGKAVLNFWLTPDDVQVTNSISREYTNVGRAYQITATDTDTETIHVVEYGTT